MENPSYLSICRSAKLRTILKTVSRPFILGTTLAAFGFEKIKCFIIESGRSLGDLMHNLFYLLFYLCVGTCLVPHSNYSKGSVLGIVVQRKLKGV